MASKPKAAGPPVPKAQAAAPRGADWRLLSVLALVYGGLVSDGTRKGQLLPPPLFCRYAAAVGAACSPSLPPPFTPLPPQLLTTVHFFALVPEPLPADADPALFSEGRAFRHLDILAGNIGHRQVCLGVALWASPRALQSASLWAVASFGCRGEHPRPPSHKCAALQVGTEGEELAAQYLYSQVQQIADQAAASRPDLTAEAARESVRACCPCLPACPGWRCLQTAGAACSRLRIALADGGVLCGMLVCSAAQLLARPVRRDLRATLCARACRRCRAA